MRRYKEERLPKGDQTARLPRLRQETVTKPNFNRRAQQIIAEHMYEGPATASNKRNTPLLQQIESTAPRSAPSHDISHLQDRSEVLNPTLAASMLAKSDYVREPSFLPKDSSSVYSDVDGMWHTLVFPSDKPSSRSDAIHLDAWINRALASDSAQGRIRPVEELVGILSVALHEVSRQVTHHCPERGKALDRIWKTYVELFERVMRQMRELLAGQKRKTARAQEQLVRAKEESKATRKSHPTEMHRVISELEENFSMEQEALEEKLKKAQEEGARIKHELRVQHRELEAWFPNFSLYQDCNMKNQFALMGRTTSVKPQQRRQSLGRAEPTQGQHRTSASEDAGPDVAIAEDFKRLLSVMNPDKRKAIGQELAGVLDVTATGQESSAQNEDERIPEKKPSKADTYKQGLQRQASAANERKAMEALREEIREQEEHIRQLRRDIMELEAGSTQASRNPSKEAAGTKEDSADEGAAFASGGEENEPDTSSDDEGKAAEVLADGSHNLSNLMQAMRNGN